MALYMRKKMPKTQCSIGMHEQDGGHSPPVVVQIFPVCVSPVSADYEDF